MLGSILTAFWIEDPDPSGPLGYGITAFSLTDALEIIRRAGYRLPDDISTLSIQVGIQFADIPHDFVRKHMGPIVVRGLWYPFIAVGLGARD